MTIRRGILAAALASGALLLHTAAAPAALPPIKHVFIVMLENEDADATFGPASKAPYLAQTLRSRGAFVPGYYGIGHLSLDNYIALVSGQGPNPFTQADAPTFLDFLPGTPGPNGQALGFGAVYPTNVKTIADQLDAKGRTWHGYMEDMANSPTEPKHCRHPASGAPDQTQQARVGDQYATRHNPFVYFHSIIDDDARCKANVVPLNLLPGDLQATSTTSSYSFITPNLCHDGHDEPCVDGQPGGLVSADRFLRSWIPKIVSSPAYQDDGLVIITFDEAENHDASACCGEQQGPNTPNNGGPTPGAGGGRIGAVLLSRYIKPGTVSKLLYNHYSLLRSTEDLFGLEHLGYAAAAGLRPFGEDIFTNPSGVTTPSGPRPTVSLSRPPSACASHKFQLNATATGQGIRIDVKVDKRLVRSERTKSLTFTVGVRDRSPGRHTIRAIATDRFGRRAIASRSFLRCGPGGGDDGDDDD
jgi:phosphatidylinositol-3-phosphatase